MNRWSEPLDDWLVWGWGATEQPILLDAENANDWPEQAKEDDAAWCVVVERATEAEIERWTKHDAAVIGFLRVGD